MPKELSLNVPEDKDVQEKNVSPEEKDTQEKGKHPEEKETHEKEHPPERSISLKRIRSSFIRKPPPIDIIQNITGAFGKYQFWLFMILALSKFPTVFHQMAIIFLSPKVSYTCSKGNATTKMSCPCPNPTYDRSQFTNTIVMEWDLICNASWLAHFSQTIFQFGVLLGSVLFGMASDRYGRKKPLLVAVVIQLSSGILCAFLPSYWLFSFFRLILAISVGGTMVTTFVIVMEFVGSSNRDLVSALFHVPFNLGHMLLPVIALIIRDWKYFQLAISLSAVSMLFYFYVIPETPRWLVAVKRTEEAIAILEHVAKVNKRPTEHIRRDVEIFQAEAEKHKLKKRTILDLFRTPNMRKNIMIMAFDWFTCSSCFYGGSQYVGRIGGNIYLNVEISASLTLLGTLLSIPLMRMFGRKPIIVAFNLSAALCMIILAFIPKGVGEVIFSSVAMVSSFIVFVLVYLFCCELFPTVVRNAAIGFSSMMARVGAMLSPFVIHTGDIAIWLPPIIFAISPLIATFLTLFLPETKDCVLITTIEEGENLGKRQQTTSSSIKI